MLTPLSSIIGSGFLVMAPLLVSIAGAAAPLALLAILALAHAIGHVIRHNIRHVELLRRRERLTPLANQIEYLSHLVLVLAYMIAVAFYIVLLVDLVLHHFGVGAAQMHHIAATVAIGAIMIAGYWRGLDGLERLEQTSMRVQFAVVAALVVGLALHAITFFRNDGSLAFASPPRSLMTRIDMLAGTLLLVQGFETSRFLGEKYSRSVRIASMRTAQWIAATLYFVCLLLFLPVLQTIDLATIEVGAVIEATRVAAPILPALLILAAVMSQFSSAVADTGAAGGLFHENSHGVVSSRIGYLCVGATAILLIWQVDLTDIIVLASRAFAAYYLLQTILALLCRKLASPRFRQSRRDLVLFIFVAAAAAYVLIFSIPVE